jgi:hypothetical protein
MDDDTTPGDAVVARVPDREPYDDAERLAVIERGEVAAADLLSGSNWDNWLLVGRAVMALREQAMIDSHSDAPQGRRYADALNRLLKERPALNKLAGGKTARATLLNWIENRDAIAEWASVLTESQRLAYDTPRRLYDRWQRSTKPPTPRRRSRTVVLEEEKAALEAEVEDMRSAKEITPRSSAADVLQFLYAALGPKWPTAKWDKVIADLMTTVASDSLHQHLRAVDDGEPEVPKRRRRRSRKKR